ncbi:MAG: tRNA 2-selenouridine(34) synthase MnmH [Proteobacteria bacterium]|nr:MAG: tRNA 2-selenouridine(34) synthase MnmH [Pseudomonadota bacterium]PIE40313.1 MAG: tRNA 2-selenouridine(34) synthase MnmH [Gammaproteobacteria bacterium]
MSCEDSEQPSAGKRQDTDDYNALFLSDTPMFDTRAPIEFARGAFPGVVNLPLMTDRERELVGTCYKQQGQEAAIRLGHQLVSGDSRQQRLDQWLEFARKNPDGYLYCFRGGLRSHTVQKWMAEAGCEYPLVKGGYKAMRRFLIDRLDQLCDEFDRPDRPQRLLLLAGQTGAGKTDLLGQIDNSIDLEELANHRGSAFGKRASAQPGQIDFENAVSIQFLRQQHKAVAVPIILEDEGRLIGRCALPPRLRNSMQQASLVVVEAGLEQRIDHSFRNYILEKLSEWQKFCGEPDSAFHYFADELRQSMSKIRKRLGGARYQAFSELLEQAIRAHQAGDSSVHRQWIERLLVEYYDPQYSWNLERRGQKIVFRGDREEVLHYLEVRSRGPEAGQW